MITYDSSQIASVMQEDLPGTCLWIMVLNPGLSYSYFKMKYTILGNWRMQPLKRFFLISLVTRFFSQHFFETKPFSPKTFPFENRWKNRTLKSKIPQFRWIILESVTGIWGRKAVQSTRHECHLPVALQTPTEPHSAHCHSTAATCYSWDSNPSHCRALLCCTFTAKLWVWLGFPCLGFWIVLVL